MAIWSRLEGKAIEVQRQPDRLACGLIQRPSGKAMLVVGTVLPWLSDSLWPGADGFCSALDGQVAEWTRLKTMQPDAELVVAGDFNQSLPYQQHYGTKAGAEELGDALEAQGLFCLTEGNDLLTGKPRIDHLCIKDSMSEADPKPVAQTWPIPCVQGIEISDHAGVRVDLDF